MSFRATNSVLEVRLMTRFTKQELTVSWIAIKITAVQGGVRGTVDIKIRSTV